jgi:predicted ribosomally synthesized peptide with nif11-like leader
MSKAQLNSFLAKAAADPALQARLDAAPDPAAVVALALEVGNVFSPATLSRHQRD